MLHAYHQLGLEPLRIGQPRGLKRSPGCSETPEHGEKLCSLIVTQGDKCCPGIIKAFTVRVREQSSRRSSFAVAIHPDNDKDGFGKALGLEPSLGATRAISCACLFGDNALKPMLSTCFEERGTVTYELFAELNACFLIVSD